MIVCPIEADGEVVAVLQAMNKRLNSTNGKESDDDDDDDDDEEYTDDDDSSNIRDIQIATTVNNEQPEHDERTSRETVRTSIAQSNQGKQERKATKKKKKKKRNVAVRRERNKRSDRTGHKEHPIFTEGDEELIKAFASHLSVAVLNCFSNTEKREREKSAFLLFVTRDTIGKGITRIPKKRKGTKCV